VVAGPGHGQVGQHLLVLGEPLVGDGVPGGHDEVPVGEHGALGLPGGARGVEDDGHVVGPPPGDLPLQVLRVGRPEGPAALLQRLQAQQAGVRVVAEPARVVVDHVLQARAVPAHLQELVHLLLVLHHGEARLGVVHHVLHLALDGVLVERHRDPPEGLGGQHGPVELRPVVPHDGGLVAPGEAQRGQPERDEARLLPVVRPGVGQPDPVVLLADGHLPRPSPGTVLDQLGEGVERRVQVGGGGRGGRHGHRRGLRGPPVTYAAPGDQGARVPRPPARGRARPPRLAPVASERVIRGSPTCADRVSISPGHEPTPPRTSRDGGSWWERRVMPTEPPRPPEVGRVYPSPPGLSTLAGQGLRGDARAP